MNIVWQKKEECGPKGSFVWGLEAPGTHTARSRCPVCCSEPFFLLSVAAHELKENVLSPHPKDWPRPSPRETLWLVGLGISEPAFGDLQMNSHRGQGWNTQEV